MTLRWPLRTLGLMMFPKGIVPNEVAEVKKKYTKNSLLTLSNSKITLILSQNFLMVFPLEWAGMEYFALLLAHDLVMVVVEYVPDIWS